MNAEFDKYTQTYVSDVNSSIKKYSEFDATYYQNFKIDYMLNDLKIKEPIKILDFGCGIGNGCKYLAEKLPESYVYGLDVSRESINLASDTVKNVIFNIYDGINMPYENEFDVIYTSCVFHHIDKKQHEKIIKMLLKSLKKGGRVYIFEHNPYNPITQKVVKQCDLDKNAALVYPHEFRKIIRGKLKYILFIPRYKCFKKLFIIEKYLSWLPIGAQYCYFISKN